MRAPQTIAEVAPLLRQKKISPVEITQACLDRIEKLDSALNSFIAVMADSALAEARQAEAEIGRGQWRGPLHGIPIAIKDLIDVAGARTTAASARLPNPMAQEDAEVIRRLRAGGAVILGKNNLHEFAYGGSSLVSHFGDVHNPRNAAHIAGGSSGGSAAAVAAGLCYAAIGTDTAGSIREPAALCGCVGLKPTYGRVSCTGVIPLSWSLDHVGPLAATVEDAALVLHAIAGFDAAELASVDIPVSDYVGGLRDELKTLRVGIPRGYFFDDLDEDVAAVVERSVVLLRPMVAEVREVGIEVPRDRTVQMAEAYAYHSENAARTPEFYQPETLRRIRSGAEIPAGEYIWRRREMEQERRRAREFFAEVDLLVTPTCPLPAPTIAELKEDPDALRPAELVLLRNTRPFNVWGLPAISVPCGLTRSGLPIGLQIAGVHWREDLVLRLAHGLEQAVEGGAK
jgi:aspartyl-tRNA(Asn)/glutamyl-tRNA(Gln) amidotransferase subunit A